jgi:geranylgeranyl reductase family protein
MKIEEFDVLIVGAGPAGSFAAERLAAGGARVALFDGRPEGEPKACGGGVTAKALKAWPHLLGAVGRTVNELELYSPSGQRLHLELDEPFAIYSRVAFDSYLRDRAQAAGAEIISQKISARAVNKTDDGWKICSAGGREWSGKALVGADGANSVVARVLIGPLPNSEMGIAFGYRAPLPERSDTPTVIAFLPSWPGYAWAFPRPDHISFGIAISQRDFKHSPLDHLLWDFMTGYYCVAEDKTAGLWPNMQKGDSRRSEIKQGLRKSAERYAARVPELSPRTWETRRCVGDDWALIGDAAGFVNPVTDEGIYYALRSAELFTVAYLEGDVLGYEATWRFDFGSELHRAANMRARFYGCLLGGQFTERMISLARAHPGIKRTLAGLISGDQGYSNLKSTLAFRALSF